MDTKINDIGIKKYSKEQLDLILELLESIALKEPKEKLIQESINKISELMHFYAVIVFFKDPQEEILRFGYFSD